MPLCTLHFMRESIRATSYVICHCLHSYHCSLTALPNRFSLKLNDLWLLISYFPYVLSMLRLYIFPMVLRNCIFIRISDLILIRQFHDYSLLLHSAFHWSMQVHCLHDFSSCPSVYLFFSPFVTVSFWPHVTVVVTIPTKVSNYHVIFVCLDPWKP